MYARLHSVWQAIPTAYACGAVWYVYGGGIRIVGYRYLHARCTLFFFCFLVFFFRVDVVKIAAEEDL